MIPIAWTIKRRQSGLPQREKIQSFSEGVGSNKNCFQILQHMWVQRCKQDPVSLSSAKHHDSLLLGQQHVGNQNPKRSCSIAWISLLQSSWICQCFVTFCWRGSGFLGSLIKIRMTVTCIQKIVLSPLLRRNTSNTFRKNTAVLCAMKECENSHGVQ